MLRTNIVLTGMPGSGKSTVGEKLSDESSMDFIDIDRLIKENTGMSPKKIVIEYGREYFLKVQKKIILELDVSNHIIATGGSVVYNKESMMHLRKKGIIVFLKTPFNQVKKRLGADRKLAGHNDQSLYDMYMERYPLYEKYADITIDCSNKSVNDVLGELKTSLDKSKGAEL